MNIFPRILLVEDDPNAIEFVHEAFKEAWVPHSIEVSTDGEAALRYLYDVQDKPHLILMDINLPKISGLDVLKEIKRDPKLRIIPVVMLTNSRSQDDVIEAHSNYCNAYVRKPLGYDMLVETVRSIQQFWFDIATLPEGPPVSRPPMSTITLSK